MTAEALARALLAEGRSVIPIGTDKRPHGGVKWKAFQARPADRETFEAWARANPPAWAVVTGAVSHLVVLDFDGLDGQVLMRMHRLEPHVVTPSGGAHLWVEHPGWEVPTINYKTSRSLGERFRGLDVRADGGYACFAGKVLLPDGRWGEYRQVRPLVPVRLSCIPASIREATGVLRRPRPHKEASQQPKRSPRPATREYIELMDRLLSRALEIARAEGRNNAMFWLATQARDNGFCEADDFLVRRYMAGIGDTNTKGEREPFTLAEAMRTWRSAFARPPREAWEVVR